MLTALIVVFVIAYAAIALEHPLKINKSASVGRRPQPAPMICAR